MKEEEIKVTDTRKDIIKTLSFLNSKETKFPLSYREIGRYLKIPDGIMTEINDRRELDVRYLLEKDQIEINAYNEDYHNGNSYQDMFYYADLNDYLEKTVALILKSLSESLYRDCFNKEKDNLINDMVTRSLVIKLNNL